jgi:hypothetical protein
MINFLLLFLLNVNIFAQEQNEAILCNPQLSLPVISSQSIELTKKVQATLGVSPLFCRWFQKAADDKDDEKLKKIVEVLVKNDNGQTTSEEINKAVLKVMERVAMKKLWGHANDTVRTRIYFSKECAKAQLNKWPYINQSRAYDSSDKSKDDKVLKSIMELCKGGHSFETLAPFLSKDVINESILILSQVYPKNFKQIKKFTCTNFDKNEKVILSDEMSSSIVLSGNDLSDRQEFVAWLKSTLSYRTKSSYYSSSLEEKVDEIFQFQNRGKASYEIISSEEGDAIESYTRENYGTINGCLRWGDCDEKTKKTIEKMISGLSKLKNATPNQAPLLFRGVASLPAPVVASIYKAIESKEALVLDKAFLSTSGTGKEADSYTRAEEKSFRFLIKAKSCVGISDVASTNVKNEDEFLCPPNMKFKINKTEIPNVLTLEEVE